MQQTNLALMARLNGPAVVPVDLIRQCRTYRDVVRLGWQLRRVHHMTQRQLACEAGLRPQHVTDYLNADDKPTRRSLPAECIAAFEAVVGNTAVSQWLAWRATLTVLEEMQAMRAAA